MFGVQRSSFKSVFIKEMGRSSIRFKCFVAKEVKMRQKDLTGR